jgi:hypothetical protein
MIRIVHLEKRFEKELEGLWQSGQKSALAARKTEKLIKALTQKGPPDLKKVWKLTGWGEKRIEGCLKYDLGDGFRVVCFRRRETLFVSFIGDHDECQKYLDHYSGRHNWVAKENGTTLSVRMNEPPDAQKASSANEDFADDYEDLLMQEIDDKVLRKVFRDLVKNEKPSHPSC